jgi:hypothetical protein
MHQPDPAQFHTPRSADRVERAFEAKLCRDGHPDLIVRVENLSAHGFRMTDVPDLPDQAFFHLEITPEIRLPAQARWLLDGAAGCEFPRHLTSRQFLQVLQATGAEQPPAPPAGLFARLRGAFSRAA